MKAHAARAECPNRRWRGLKQEKAQAIKEEKDDEDEQEEKEDAATNFVVVYI